MDHQPHRLLDERFNLNNYRDPSQRRPSTTVSVPQASTSASVRPPRRTLAPRSTLSAINVPFGDHVVHQSNIPGDIYRDVHTTPGDISTIQAIPFTVSPPAAPEATPLRDNYTITGASHPGIFIPHSTSPFLANSVHALLIPTPPLSAVPANGRLTTQLLEKLDLLVSRQDLVVKFARESLMGQDGRSAHRGTRPKQQSTSDVPRISTVDGTTVAVQAISTLAERMQSLTEGIAIIRDVLGISGESPAPGLREDLRKTKGRRLSRSTLPATPHLGTPAGTTADNAIVVDEDEDAASPIERESSARLSGDTVRRRSIIERLHSMEVDFAEFMERVKEPEANTGKIRDLSLSGAKSNEGKCLTLSMACSLR
ncbi:hypothetical protein HYPSUDRAFT_409108 [Hypholoma sublateritium FD-334 SS-4]|uniref:Uncharacterized protein n=1 Tax=Hypholoma sublateritium (strain FD-334 SS-4) TaxID=945553 RepID=A0A0D2Q241_HYPSF|nr:hypothetical protein HYPSUDRAFT_409108 [Hypholoma sublateritium FD-334 SS-4]